MAFQQPSLPTGKAPLSNLSKLREVAAIGCTESDLSIKQVQVYDWFEQWNQAFFGNRLRPVHVNVSLTAYGKKLGLCYYSPVQYIEVHPNCWRGAAQHHQQAIGNMKMPDASWVLLHEMMHLAEAQTVGTPGRNAHNSQAWIGWCNFIAQELDLPLSYSQMKRGKNSVAEGRKNVWIHSKGAVVRPGTRLASYDEMRCFPYLATDLLMQDNLETNSKGESQLPGF